MTHYFKILIPYLIFLFISSCGYHLQNTNNPLYYQKGIEKIYIQSIKNNSTTLGIENTVLRAMIQELESQKKVRFVNSPKNADAFLVVNINDASYSGINASSIKNIEAPGVNKDRIPDNVSVASEYTASLSCSFQLLQPSNSKILWSATLSKQKFFPANNKLGVLGTTSALINESEFKRSISDLSTTLMSELSEHMLGMF